MTLVTEAQIDDVPEGKNVLVTLDSTGDTRVEWDPTNAIELEHARATFAKLVNEKRFAAYAMTESGNPGRAVRTFDPEARKLIFVPPMVGG